MLSEVDFHFGVLLKTKTIDKSIICWLSFCFLKKNCNLCRYKSSTCINYIPEETVTEETPDKRDENVTHKKLIVRKPECGFMLSMQVYEMCGLTES